MKVRYKLITYRTGAGVQDSTQHLLDYIWDRSRNSFSAYDEWRPPVDVFETENEVHVVIEIAGVSEEDLDVTLFRDVILVKGERKMAIEDTANLVYHEAGVRYGRFKAAIELPTSVDPDRIDARYDAGFLRITLTKQGARSQ